MMSVQMYGNYYNTIPEAAIQSTGEKANDSDDFLCTEIVSNPLVRNSAEITIDIC